MSLLRRRWLPPAALSALCGLLLAVWMHDEHVAEPDRPAPAAQPRDDPARQLTAAPQEPPAASFDNGPTPDVSEQLEQLRDELDQRVDQDVEGALTALLRLEEKQRRYLEEDVVRRAARRDPDRTLQWLGHNVADDAERERLLTAAYAGIASVDPTFAMNLAQTLSGTEARRLASHQVLEAWAATDVVAAYDWVASQGDPEGAGDLYTTVMQVYVRQYPQQAGDLIAGLPEGQAKARLVDRYAYDLAESDVPAALDWLSQFGEEDSTRDALTSVVDRWAQRDPWAAMDYAALNVDGELSFELVERVVAEMGSTRPRELAASLHRVPEEYRPLAAQRLANAWAFREPGQARRWAETLPPGELRGAALRGAAGIAERG